MMVNIQIDIKRSVEENAGGFFEKSKTSKRKMEGAKKVLQRSEAKLADLRAKEAKDLAEPEALAKKRKPEWFEKFRWFVSSDGFLVIGGRDATTNEIIIKKHTDKADLVLHTDIAGSPFAVIKAEGADIPKTTIEEAGQFVACYSRAWRLGLSTLPVFYVKPEQVSKTARAGEYLTKGAFMIYGETHYLHPDINMWVGLMDDGKVMCGSQAAVKKHCKKMVAIEQGKEKASDAAKLIRKVIGAELDDIIRVLPAGGVKVKVK